MYGAILGDIIGSPFEFDMGDKSKEFQLFSRRSGATDDSLMTLAVYKGISEADSCDDESIKSSIVRAMREIGNEYPNAGYGLRFSRWLDADEPQPPYYSYGNGSAMRVSCVGWMYDTLEEVRHMAKLSAEVTHNHPEGIKGAVATAGAVFLARTGATMDDLMKYISKYYTIDFTIDEIRPLYDYDITCQGTVPQAMQAFFESENFEDAIRNAISIGGDSDTLAAITGAVAEAYYGIPDNLKEIALSYLDDRLLDITERFEEKYIG